MDYKEKLEKIKNLAGELAKYKGVSLGERVKAEPNVFFDTENGPIVIGDDSIIRAGTVLRGPIWAGKNSRLGGEIEHSWIGNYTNKQHYGYLGHSYIGSWVNIGGGTSVSDLKNTYGAIKVKGEDTGQMKLGAIIGDYVKTAVNTSIFCGKVIGDSAHLYGMVTEDVPAFASHVSPGNMYELPIDLAIKIQKAMSARRNVEFTKADEEEMRKLFAETQAGRDKAGVKKEKLSFL
ncbi:MAG: hypothetical protein AAB500_01100 [Patescibacteria group bacterium]|mgnify:CR=1 FL=1